eukprot:Pompholyxophrys_punicea_v1_NODE_1479_length_693_cov_1.202194.p1 type:complete len:127 gc:universal NODE_1479_length_693_cov_1.202194:182-562(+)
MSHDIQNEILEIAAHMIQRRLAEEIRSNGFFILIADETTDTSTVEQVSVCVRTVDKDLSPSEYFLGFYSTSTTDASPCTNCSWIMLRLDLPVAKLRCQTYAANMSGLYNGVQAKMKEVQPLALYVL